MLPFKKRAQFLCSDDSSQSVSYPESYYDDPMNSSTSNLIKLVKDENKPETLISMEFQKISSSSCTTNYDKDAMSNELIRSSSLGSQDDDGAVGEEKQECNVIEHDGGGGGVSNDDASDIVGDGTKDVMEDDGGGGGNRGVPAGSCELCDVKLQEHQTKMVIEHENNSNGVLGKEDQIMEHDDHQGESYCIVCKPDDVVEHGKQMHHDEAVKKIEASKILEDDVVSIIGGCDGNETLPLDHNRNATDIVDDGEQVHEADHHQLGVSSISLIELIRDEKWEEQGKPTAIEEDGTDGRSIVEDEDQKGKKQMKYATIHDNSIQQAAFEVSDGGSSAIQQDPMTIAYVRKRQSNQRKDGGGGDAQGRKKTKVGGGSSNHVDGSGSSEMIVKNTFKLFGVNIPYQEHHPLRWLKLLGVDIPVPQQQEVQQAVARNGSVGHKSSMQRPKLGLRLMGSDL